MRHKTLSLYLAGLLLFPCAMIVADEPETFDEFRSQENEAFVGKFTFVRVEYDSVGGYGEAYYDYDGRRWQRWETDFPEAEENFLYRLDQLTTVDPNPRADTRRLTDDDIFDFPFLYMCDVGWMELTPEETARMREYLLRGGFVWVDDFWGWAEWNSFAEMMEQAFPEIRPKPIPPEHPILNIVYPMKACPQIPARDFAIEGFEHDPPWIHRSPTSGPTNMTDQGVERVNFQGWWDEEGRLIAIATHNTDIGDGWEREAMEEWFFQEYSTKAYAMGINIIVYVLSH